MRAAFFLFLLGMIIPIVCSAQSGEKDSLTITTYYPSPYGVYRQMQTRTLGVGDNDGNGVIDSDDVPPATSSGDVWISGKVGIGVTDPQEQLDVKGIVRSGGAKGTGRLFSVSASQLQNYHSGAPLTQPATVAELEATIAACQRYCSYGCTASTSGCNGVQPGLGFHGGMAVEWNSLYSMVACICF